MKDRSMCTRLPPSHVAPGLVFSRLGPSCECPSQDPGPPGQLLATTTRRCHSSMPLSAHWTRAKAGPLSPTTCTRRALSFLTDSCVHSGRSPTAPSQGLLHREYFSVFRDPRHAVDTRISWRCFEHLCIRTSHVTARRSMSPGMWPCPAGMANVDPCAMRTSARGGERASAVSEESGSGIRLPLRPYLPYSFPFALIGSSCRLDRPYREVAAQCPEGDRLLLLSGPPRTAPSTHYRPSFAPCEGGPCHLRGDICHPPLPSAWWLPRWRGRAGASSERYCAIEHDTPGD